MFYNYRKPIAEFDLEVLNLEVETFCEQHEVPAPKLFSIQLIIEEIVTNIIKYGTNGGQDKVIEIAISLAGEGIQLTIADNSPAFNPLETEEPDLGLTAEDRAVGGLGLFLVRKKVKSLRYENQNGFNILKAEI